MIHLTTGDSGTALAIGCVGHNRMGLTVQHAADTLPLDLDSAFAQETRRGAMLAIVLCALWSVASASSDVLVASFLRGRPAFLQVPPEILYSGIFIVLLPVPLYLAAVFSKTPLRWCFIALLSDALAFAQLEFNWFFGRAVFAAAPGFMSVRYGDIVTFIILVSIYALPLSRRFIAWGTVAVVLVWTAGITRTFLIYKPATLYWGPLGAGMGDKGLRDLMNPEALSPDFFLLQIFLLMAFAGFLALAIGQGRRFVVKRVAAAADAALLGRFFPPSIAERLLDADLIPARRSVAILFAQIAADRPASGLLALQADFSNFERIVFVQDGIVDRFSGGPAMACFGALADDKDAPMKALLCARRLAEESGLGLKIALHWGEAVCGELGGSHSRLFSVVGDAVNVTRRILDIAQDRGLRIVASDSFVRRTASAHLPAQNLGEVLLRGRDAAVTLWALSP